MALFHFHVTQVKRSAGQSIVTSAAYRAGEKLYSEYYGEVSDYTHKGGVVCTDILLPPQAPAEYQDRATLWNAVEKAERGKKAQLATITNAPKVQAITVLFSGSYLSYNGRETGLTVPCLSCHARPCKLSAGPLIAAFDLRRLKHRIVSVYSCNKAS